MTSPSGRIDVSHSGKRRFGPFTSEPRDSVRGGGEEEGAALILPFWTEWSQAFRLIGSPTLSNCLLLLKPLRNFASLSIFHRYFLANYYSQLAVCMSGPPLTQRRCILHSIYADILALSELVVQETASIAILSSLLLAGSGTALLFFSFLPFNDFQL